VLANGADSGLCGNVWRLGRFPARTQELFRTVLRLLVGNQNESDWGIRVTRMATRKRSRLAATLAAAGVVLASLPTAGFALGGLSGGINLAQGSFAALTPASADPRLAAFVAERSSGTARLMRFTPAGAERASRSVTVAVRVDEDSAQAISVRSAIEAAMDKVAGESGVRIAPSRYSLGASRGYQNFARPAPAPALSRTVSDASIPDLADFRPSPGAKEEPSRFAARLDSNEPAKPAAVAPRIATDQSVDLEGSYRLTRNLDVTAGVRYSQDRNRLAPLAEPAKQDSQAVYVGTQFRF